LQRQPKNQAKKRCCFEQKSVKSKSKICETKKNGGINMWKAKKCTKKQKNYTKTKIKCCELITKIFEINILN